MRLLLSSEGIAPTADFNNGHFWSLPLGLAAWKPPSYFSAGIGRPLTPIAGMERLSLLQLQMATGISLRSC